MKFVAKGFKYFKENGGALRKIKFRQVTNFNEKLNACLRCCEDLEVIAFEKCYIDQNTAKSIGKILSDYKLVKELDLTESTISSVHAKEIADGLMRAKKLENLIFKNVVSVGPGVNPILYNLAFAPKIQSISISGLGGIQGNRDTAEAVYKLIKISGSLEYLDISGTGLLSTFDKNFYVSLGENKTIKALIVNGVNNNITGNSASNLGTAIAMNDYKNGSLSIFSGVGTMDANTFKSFGTGLCISEKDHEDWYGDRTVANKMKGEQLIQKFRNPLKIMLLGLQRFDHQDNIAHIKKQPTPNWPKLVHAFCSGLQVIDLTQS